MTLEEMSQDIRNRSESWLKWPRVPNVTVGGVGHPPEIANHFTRIGNAQRITKYL